MSEKKALRAFPILAFLLALGAVSASAKGIRVRFLAAPAEDSAIRYDVYRSQAAGGQALRVGTLPASAGSDTLSYPDTSAERGLAYLYSIRAVNAAGGESDPSESTLVALPLLSLPDTLRSKPGGPARLILPSGADPLMGNAPLSLSLVGGDGLAMLRDSADGALEFRSSDGKADTVLAVITASYYGKFRDADTVVVVMEAAPARLAIAPRPGAAPAIRPGFTRGNARHAVPLTAAGRGGGAVLYDPAGRRIGSRPR